MNFENLSLWYWIIIILVGIVCGIFGYLLGKRNSRISTHTDEMISLKNRNTALTADLQACNDQLETTINTPSVSLSSLDEVLSFNAVAAKAAFGKTIKENDLKLVEGIGPKIEGLFHNFDIKTWEALSEVSVSKCQEVLDSGGDRYRIHDPSSWPMQAKMCYEGKWKDLVKWQDKHKAGKF